MISALSESVPYSSSQVLAHPLQPLLGVVLRINNVSMAGRLDCYEEFVSLVIVATSAVP
jgi:hypothetical protein